MDNKVKFRIQFIKENNRIELFNREQLLRQFFNLGTDDLCKDCSAGDMSTQKRPSSSKSWKRQGNEIIGIHINTFHGHKYLVECLNIRRRPTNRQNDESTDQSQIAQSTGLNAINLDTAISIDDLLRLRPVEPPPAELTQLSDCLKNLNAELSSIQFQNTDQRQLNEQFKQQLCREIGELRTKLDLVSDRYNLTADLQYKAADQPYGIAQAVQPLNTFILVPISLTQPPAGPALNQPNQTQPNQMQSNQMQPSAELRCPGQLTNQSRPNKDDLMAQLNRAMLGQQMNQQMNQQQGQQPSQSNCPAASSSGGHYLFDDNFSRIGGLDEINQNRMLLASIHQKQQSKAGLVQPANPDQQQKPVEFRLIKQSDGTVTVLNLVGRSDVQ